MSIRENVTTEEIAFSLALSLSMTVTFLKAIQRHSANKESAPKEWSELINTLQRLMEDSVAVSGKERASTGQEKSAILMDMILEMSRPDNTRSVN
jgi:hypothetical protein